ncbi:MAG: tetratricopeptide repeat protein [Chitinophagaceae bacterium]|nr:tetratricopeptide repeat protein [Chitinophagaceae bacterium]
MGNQLKTIQKSYPMRGVLAILLFLISAISFAQKDSSDFYFNKGLEEKQKGRLMESYRDFEKAYNYNKSKKQIVSELASALFNLRRYSEARAKYLQLEQMGDQSAATYKQLMILSFNLHQLPDAIKYANLLNKVDPKEKTAFFVGKAYYDDENYGSAIKFLTTAAQDDPGNAEIPYMIARAYSDMQNYKQAISYFEKAIALEPNNSRWMYETGLIYYAMNDDKNSLKYLLMAADKGYKQDNEYLENLAVAYLNTSNFEKGLNILKEILQRRPSDINLLNMIAEACYDARRYDDAINYWDDILKIDKQNASALYMIGMSYQKKGEKQKGTQLCDKAIEMDPSLSSLKQKISMPGGF